MVKSGNLLRKRSSYDDHQAEKLLGSNTTRIERNPSGISSRYKRDQSCESHAGKSYFHPHPGASCSDLLSLIHVKDLLSECVAGYLLPPTVVSDKSRPSQGQEEASSADCQERFKLIPTAELVAAPKCGGSDGTTFLSSRLDSEASPLGLEAPSDGLCQSEDASNMMKPMGSNPEPSTSLSHADIVLKDDTSPAIESEGLPVSPPPIYSISDSLATRRNHL